MHGAGDSPLAIGIDATHLFWHNKFQATGVASTVLKVVGRGLDTLRTPVWVRRHDVVVVPGAGVLEASLPMVPRVAVRDLPAVPVGNDIQDEGRFRQCRGRRRQPANDPTAV